MNSMIALVEIPAQNFSRAKSFYESLFSVTLKGYDTPEEKMAFFPSGDIAISYAKDFNPSNQGTLLSFQASGSLDEIIAKIPALGGAIKRPKTKIDGENMGFFALFEDTEGNRLGLYGDPE